MGASRAQGFLEVGQIATCFVLWRSFTIDSSCNSSCNPNSEPSNSNPRATSCQMDFSTSDKKLWTANTCAPLVYIEILHGFVLREGSVFSNFCSFWALTYLQDASRLVCYLPNLSSPPWTNKHIL